MLTAYCRNRAGLFTGKAVLLIVGCVACFTAPALQTVHSQGGAQPVAKPPVAFDYEDVDRFGAALRAIAAGTPAEAAFQQYLDSAGSGLRQWTARYRVTASSYARAQARYPKYFSYLGSLRPALKARETTVADGLVRLRELVAGALGRTNLGILPVYYFVSPMGGGGSMTITANLAAVDYFGRNPDAPLAEFDGQLWPQGAVPLASLEILPHTVIHEAVHGYQAAAMGFGVYTSLYREPGNDILLARAIREGGADFVARLASAEFRDDRMAWGLAHEDALWRAFRPLALEPTARHPGWFSGRNPDFPDAPWQIGYFLGERICRAYYERATDKPEALRRILTASSVADYQAIMAAYAAETAPAPGAQQPKLPPKLPIEGTNGRWLVEGAERQADARVAEFQGRSALWLKNNSHVLQAGTEEFVDGTIEFDVAPMERGDFIAIVFRRESPQNHENIYLRPFSSGLFEAMQYAPRINGSASWQLYPEFNTTADLPRNQWTHLRIEVKGTGMEVYVNNTAKPALSVARLRGIPTKGPVGFWARANNDPKTWAAALSNVTIRPAAAPDKVATARPAPAAGTITHWEVTAPVNATPAAITRLPQLSGWRQVEVEESGLVNLNRAVGRHNGRGTVFARTTIKAEQARTLPLEIGYSDDVTVFVNGEPVYSGINGWESRHPGYFGFVKAGYETVHLRLRQGDNEIILAVTDDQRFGWGFAARTVSP